MSAITDEAVKAVADLCALNGVSDASEWRVRAVLEAAVACRVVPRDPMGALTDAIAGQLHAIGYKTDEEIAEHGELTARQKQIIQEFADGVVKEFTERMAAPKAEGE